jgi:type II secretory pathway pseudopilin PulG
VARRDERCRGFRGRKQQGYILLTLLLIIALVIIAAAALAPNIARQVERDREEELIHRGMQYRRAIRAFVKRTGTYPLRLEQLENTNGTRFLRRRYKDPITGGDFRLLHQSDILAYGRVNLNLNQNQANPDQSPDQNAINPDNAASADSGTLPASSSQANQSTSPVAPGQQNPGLPAASGQAPADPALVGGLIFGVVSKSKKKTIREFEHKNHYNEWLFFYSQTYDGSYEVKGPTPTTPVPLNLSPNAPGAPNSPDQNGQPGQFGQPSQPSQPPQQ